MKSVRLKGTALVGETHYGAGDVVSVPDDRAHRMVASGQGEFHDGTTADADNADEVNPLADTLTPLPRGAVPVHPPDAIAPNVADHPGLKTLVEVLGVDSEVDAKGRTATIRPVPTSDIASPEAIEASHRLANPPAGAAPTHEEAAAMVADRDDASARAERESEGDAETADIRPGGRVAARAAGRPRTKAAPPAESEVKVPASGPATGTPGPSGDAPKPGDAPKAS